MTHPLAAPSRVPCPCCGEVMNYALVVCWDCYGLSQSLTAGTEHVHNVTLNGDHQMTEERKTFLALLFVLVLIGLAGAQQFDNYAGGF